MKLTPTQKLHALAYRFYQGAAWTPKAGDFYTTSRADLELYQIVSIEGGIVRTRFTEGSDAISEWTEAGFLIEGFGPKRVHVPEWVMNLKSDAGSEPIYRIGDEMMARVFSPAGLHNVSDLQAVFDAVERELIQTAAPQAAAVKLLEWKSVNEGFGHGRTYYGTGIFGHWYAVQRVKKGVWTCFHYVDGKQIFLPSQFTYFGSLEEAKAAAQADYEARILSALTTPPAQAVGVPDELLGVPEVLDEGSGIWRTCTGCHETFEGYSVGKYPYSKTLKCDLGSGCRECGGIGAIWDATDYEDFGRYLSETATPSADADLKADEWATGDMLTPEEAWTILCETPDITSPEEYPDHALITIDQLRGFMGRATPPADLQAENERLRAGIARLSDEEELCSETTGDDPFSLVYLAEKLARAETRATAAEAEIQALRKKIDNACEWHWPADDTSSDMCTDGVWGVRDNVDLQPGEVLHYAIGGVFEHRYFAFLEPATDAESDDEFEVDGSTHEEVEQAINVELARRATLKGGEV